MLFSLRLLELLDFRLLAVLPWLESVLLLEPRDRELACFGKVLYTADSAVEEWAAPPTLNVLARFTLMGCPEDLCAGFLCGWKRVLSFCFACSAADILLVLTRGRVASFAPVGKMSGAEFRPSSTRGGSRLPTLSVAELGLTVSRMSVTDAER